MAKALDYFHQACSKDFPYFRRLWNTIVAALLAASIIPMVLIGGGMYYFAVSALREKTIEDLQSEILHHKEAIDGFLEERTRDLQLLSANLDPNALKAPEALQAVFRSLQQALPCFNDLGVIDRQGRHLAYEGPYALQSKNYRDEKWFRAVMDTGMFISDVYSGFRGEPHFVIAVKNKGAEGNWVLRATVDTEYFDKIVSTVPKSRGGDAYLINRKGLYQTRPWRNGQLMAPSGIGNIKPFNGVKFREEEDGRLLLMAWLDKAPWLCVAQFNERDIYGSLRRIRNLGICVFVTGGVIVVLTVLFSTNFLVSRLEKKRQNIHRLDHLLRHATKVASTVQLASGFISDIAERTANIELIVEWLTDLIRRDSKGEAAPKEIQESLKQIKREVTQTRISAEKFFKATRPALPIVKDIDVNDILEDALELLERKLHFHRISVERDYQDSLPPIQGDPSEIRQVFQNLILNAIHAIEKDGRIILKTREDQGDAVASVKDNGRGIPRELLSQIFDPLFTTQSGRTGLGLSICADIIEGLEGHISVKSAPGEGATFTVRLPSK